MASEIEVGRVGEARTVVESHHLASALGSGGIGVFGTPAMIALMESAAINAVDHLLPEGSATVGTHVDVRHLAATPPGLEVRATAELIGVDGRRLTFRIEAHDPVDKIGEGTHERAIVEIARLVRRAEAKAP